MTVIDEIAAERRRQIDNEGYDAAHDDGHPGELALSGSRLRSFRCDVGPGNARNPPFPARLQPLAVGSPGLAP